MRRLPHYWGLLLLLLWSASAHAGLLDIYKNADGSTNWQYLANTGGGLITLGLGAGIVFLALSRRKLRTYADALTKIRDELELRVVERTAKLQVSNQKLGEEVEHHRQTSELLQSTEAYINSIIQSMPYMLIGVDKGGVVTQWNQSAQNISGVDSATALGQSLWSVYPQISIEQGHIERALTTKEPIHIEHAQHGQYYYDITVYPLVGTAEPGVVILIDDVTQRVLAESTLIQKDKMASMGELAAGMAHDINSPLSAILQAVQTVQRRLSPSLEANHQPAEAAGIDLQKLQQYMKAREINELLAGVQEAGARTSSIVSNLLEFARNSSHDKQQVDILDIIENTLELARNIFSLQGGLRFQDIRIERTYPEESPEFYCYPAEMQQVFLNLFRNANHALRLVQRDDFVPRLKIRVYVMDIMLRIEVEDNGVGMSEEVQQHIFEPFFTNKEFSDGEGTGLGLSVSHFIITEHHGGNIAVTSRQGEGSTFHIQMPCK